MVSRRNQFFLSLLSILLVIRSEGECCQDDERSEGCRIVSAGLGKYECVCGMGCRREFPFLSRLHCEVQAIGKESARDPCSDSPCLNSGDCIPLKYHGFRCECTGTGYHGDLCQEECPETIGRNAFGLEDSKIPLDCLI